MNNAWDGVKIVVVFVQFLLLQRKRYAERRKFIVGEMFISHSKRRILSRAPRETADRAHYMETFKSRVGLQSIPRRKARKVVVTREGK